MPGNMFEKTTMNRAKRVQLDGFGDKLRIPETVVFVWPFWGVYRAHAECTVKGHVTGSVKFEVYEGLWGLFMLDLYSNRVHNKPPTE